MAIGYTTRNTIGEHTMAPKGILSMDKDDRRQAKEAADRLIRFSWMSTPQGHAFWSEIYNKLRTISKPTPPPTPPPPNAEFVSSADRMVALDVRPWFNDVDDESSQVIDEAPIVISNSRGRSCRLTPVAARAMAAQLIKLAEWADKASYM